MHYFSYISYDYSPKNKLEKAIAELLKQNERLVIPEADIIKFQGKITDRVEELNNEYPRCTPFKPYFHKTGTDYHFSPTSPCNFHLYASK